MTVRNRSSPAGNGESKFARTSDGPWREQWEAGRARLVVPVVAVVAVGAWLSGTLSGFAAPGWGRIGLVTLGAVCTAASAAIPLWQRRRANAAQVDAVQAARAARAQLRLALSDTLDPFVHLLGRLATARQPAKSQLRGEAIALTVAAVMGLAGPPRARVCFFALERDPLVLRPDRFAGRSGAPTTVFTEQTPGGAGALGIAQGIGWLYIPDTSAQTPPYWIDDERRYRCVLLGPVATPDAAVGMMTIDAPEPNALDGIDMALVRLLSMMLATALSL